MSDIEANILRGDPLEARELALWSHLLSVVRQAKADALEFELETEAAYKCINGRSPKDEMAARRTVGELLECLRVKSVQVFTSNGLTACAGYISSLTYSTQKSSAIIFSMDESIRKVVASSK